LAVSLPSVLSPSVAHSWLDACKGNHFRWWQQIGPDANSGAYFLAVSNEANLARHHEIVVNGYNTGRDELGAFAARR
jgi:hypothetical protein